MKLGRMDTIKKALIENFMKGATIAGACKATKINRQTFYNWIKKDKKLKENVEIAQDSRIGIVEDALFKNAKHGNITAQIFFLCNRDKERWQNVQKMQHSSDPDNPIPIILQGVNIKKFPKQKKKNAK